LSRNNLGRSGALPTAESPPEQETNTL